MGRQINSSIPQLYFEWLTNKVGSKKDSYQETLWQLYTYEFTSPIYTDENRRVDGLSLRQIFANDESLDVSQVYDTLYFQPCSILEMMVALAMRCEAQFLWDGLTDHTPDVFWKMMESLGLDKMDDDNFCHPEVHFIIDRFLKKEYEPNGKGGLFTVQNENLNMRDATIWYQMNWYLEGQ